MIDVGVLLVALAWVASLFWISRSSKRMPPARVSHQKLQSFWQIVTPENLPGSLLSSFIRSITANNGKWFRQESNVSNPAFIDIIIIRAIAKLR
jgi:hypothetical protein